MRYTQHIWAAIDVDPFSNGWYWEQGGANLKPYETRLEEY
jgi:ABC-type tungstate transport system permease subunit